MVRFGVSAIVLSSAILLSSAAPAAGSCVQLSLAQQVAGADVIAYGWVTGTGQFLPLPPSRRVQFRVERVLKGGTPGEISVAIGPGGAAATSVDYQADSATAHTLYLRRFGDAYVTDACSGSHPGTPTAEENALRGTGGRIVYGPTARMDWVVPIAVFSLGSLALTTFVLMRRRRRRHLNV